MIPKPRTSVIEIIPQDPKAIPTTADFQHTILKKIPRMVSNAQLEETKKRVHVKIRVKCVPHRVIRSNSVIKPMSTF